MNRDQGLNTEITDKLFLELSQFTTARTAREIDLQQRLDYAEMKLAGVKQQRDVEHVSYVNEFEKNQELHAQIMALQQQLATLSDQYERLLNIASQRETEQQENIDTYREHSTMLQGVIEYAYKNYDKEGFEWERLLKAIDDTTTQNGKGE